jgi:hypothetical protein
VLAEVGEQLSAVPAGEQAHHRIRRTTSRTMTMIPSPTINQNGSRRLTMIGRRGR